MSEEEHNPFWIPPGQTPPESPAVLRIITWDEMKGAIHLKNARLQLIYELQDKLEAASSVKEALKLEKRIKILVAKRAANFEACETPTKDERKRNRWDDEKRASEWEWMKQ